MISHSSPLMGLTKALENAVTDLEELAKKNTPRPSRFHARDVLLALGNLAGADDEFQVEELAERLSKLTQPFLERWQRAVDEELQLACAEFVTSVDEKFLRLENYDFDYTTSARKRLEARLVACELLGYEIPSTLTDQVERADQTYAPYLAQHEKQ